jgi:hypothetical protein
MMMECKNHGMTLHYKRVERKNGWKCKACNKEHQKTLRNNKRNTLLEMAGGKCAICNYDRCKDALCFHHLRDKKFELKKNIIASKSIEEVLEEFEKCILLCSNCHSEVHAGLITLA